MSDLDIEYRKVDELRPQPRNPRVHSKKQIRQIARSIEAFGFVSPVLIEPNGQIIAGHGRVAAAKVIGVERVPTVCVGHLSDAQVRAYMIADNKLAENAAWDTELLTSTLKELSIDLGFDVTLTGYDTPELDLLFSAKEGVLDEDDDVAPVDRSKPAVSRLGDRWRIANHVVHCADATKAESYERLLGDEKAQIVFTDPPYNVPIDGHVSGLGRVRHDDFAMACGEMDEDEFTAFLKGVFQNLVNFSADGSLHYVCMDWRHMWEVLSAARGPYAELKNLCVWNKTNGGMGSLYRSKHELVFVFKNGTAPHVNNVELGANKRYRTNVWDYPGANSFGASRTEDLSLHPTVKPIALVADIILDASHRGAIVLDAFAGSGTTLLAAERTGRRGFALELEPHYVDTIVKRVSKALKVEAVLDGTGETFDLVSRWRALGLD